MRVRELPALDGDERAVEGFAAGLDREAASRLAVRAERVAATLGDDADVATGVVTDPPRLAADGHAVVERSDERAGAAATRRKLTRALGRLADSDAVERNGWGWQSGQTWQRLRVALDQADAV